MGIIKNIRGLEILDSRGNPTVRVFLELENGIIVKSSVPSGASTGEYEAYELRDNEKRYGGKGVRKAIHNINEIISPALKGQDVSKQMDIDNILIELDGSKNKQNLGANAILGVSMACVKGAAKTHNLEIYEYLGGAEANRLPVPCMNILNGGEHSDNSVDIQEFMAIPIGANSFKEGLRYVAETFHTLKGILKDKGLATSVGDEGGFAPNLKSNEEAIEIIIQAIEKAGYKPGVDIAIGLDSAATSFASGDKYDLKWSKGGIKTSEELIEMAKIWVNKYPIVLWEDPLAEEDWSGFHKFTQVLGDKIEVVGDDIFVTNTEFITRGIKANTANASLIKLNQIGTVTETIEAVKLCKEHNWRAFVSHRSGETCDSFLADFAVAMGTGHLKSGSASRSERLAKYNRLLEIEDRLGERAKYYWKSNI